MQDAPRGAAGRPETASEAPSPASNPDGDLRAWLAKRFDAVELGLQGLRDQVDALNQVVFPTCTHSGCSSSSGVVTAAIPKAPVHPVGTGAGTGVSPVSSEHSSPVTTPVMQRRIARQTFRSRRPSDTSEVIGSQIEQLLDEDKELDALVETLRSQQTQHIQRKRGAATVVADARVEPLRMSYRIVIRA